MSRFLPRRRESGEGCYPNVLQMPASSEMRGYFTFMYIDCYPRWPLGPMMDGYLNVSKISTITLRTRSSPDRTKLYLRWKDQVFVAIGLDLLRLLLRELWHSARDLVPCHEQN